MKNIILSLLISLACNTYAQIRIHQINVGQGCATLVEFPCAAILIDTGGETNPQYNSSDSLKSYLDDFFIRRSDLNYTLQCVYLTHPHKDHTLGVPVVLNSPYVIKNAVTNGLEQGSGKPGQIKLHRAAQDSEDNSDPLDDIGFEAITTLDLGNNGLTNTVIDPVNCSGVNPVIKILWGTSTTNPGWSNGDFENVNNHSLVIRIEYGSSSVLITGDLEENALGSLVNKYRNTNLLDADLYLTGHHSSKNGTTKEFLELVTPKIALIGVGDFNRQLMWTAWAYGHPNKGILDMLQKSIISTRSPIRVKAGTGAKTFVDYTVSKAIYATNWDNHIVIEGNATGQWTKVDRNAIATPTPNTVPSLVNVNTATETELETLPGIGSAKAIAIVKYRSRHGNFNSIDDIDDVPGIGPATIDLFRAYIKI